MSDLRNRVARAINEAHQLHGRSFYSMADAALAEMGGVRVKPLVWEETDNSGTPSADYEWHKSETPFGEYAVGCDPEGDFWAFRDDDGLPCRINTLEAAKAAAQADYEARILAAIEPAPSLREAARLLLDALNEESELDDVIQTAMQGEADTDGTDEWVFVLRAGLRAIAEGKDDE